MNLIIQILLAGSILAFALRNFKDEFDFIRATVEYRSFRRIPIAILFFGLDIFFTITFPAVITFGTGLAGGIVALLASNILSGIAFTPKHYDKILLDDFRDAKGMQRKWLIFKV